jgi:dTDP-4-amino-4,6-dideoxygalactose transaminase
MKNACYSKPIYVTEPYLPPLEEFIPYLEKIWGSKILTNGGPFHQQLEKALCEYLGVEHISLFANGTLALVVALKALNISGEVITSPYSFVATANSLFWNGIEPVFVDIDPSTLNLDPVKIEAAITPRTTAIMPVHCYGYPSNVEAIQEIADNYNLKVIYDSAHAFGVEDEGGSILRHGNLSAMSFHATKIFNTFEGGAIVCPDANTKQHIDQLKNFGYVNESTIASYGLNAKMNEIQAALGLIQLKHMDDILSRRAAIDARYREALGNAKGVRLHAIPSGIEPNFSYFPIFIENDFPQSRDQLYEHLLSEGIHARRYFFPLISAFDIYSSFPSGTPENVPIATKVANEVLCLPIYPDLEQNEQERILHAVIKISDSKA